MKDILYEDINNSKASKNKTLNNIRKYIFFNQYIESMFEKHMNFKTGMINGIMHYMCLTIDVLGKKSIVHYFSVFMKNDMYYISSSNGSDNVSVPQYTSILSQEQWDRFVDDIQSDEQDDENKRQAILDYFMGGTHMHETVSGGIDSEIKYYMKNKLTLHCTKSSDYSIPITEIVEPNEMIKYLNKILLIMSLKKIVEPNENDKILEHKHKKTRKSGGKGMKKTVKKRAKTIKQETKRQSRKYLKKKSRNKKKVTKRKLK